MKIKVDENLPESLVSGLNRLGHDVDSVPIEGLAGRKDSEVWSETQSAGRFLLTQDLDFADIQRFTPGTHHGLLLVRMPLAGLADLKQRIEGVFGSQPMDSWRGCFVVLSDHKLRVIRPKAD